MTALLLCVLGLLAPPPATEPRPMTADALLSAADDWIRYEVGNPEFRGRTTVAVHGDGRVDVTSQRGADRRSWSGALDAASLDALRRTLGESDPRRLASQRAKGNPGEDRARLTWRHAGAEASVELWYNEQWQIPPFRALVVAFQALAGRFSNGDVRY